MCDYYCGHRQQISQFCFPSCLTLKTSPWEFAVIATRKLASEHLVDCSICIKVEMYRTRELSRDM